ncbi:MAG: UDP-2,3-diacylglucosamine diphosphatase [bacterium]
MAIYFLSDFHLGEGDAATEARKLERFKEFISRSRADLEHLVLLGDLFDFWFEYRHLIPKRNLQLLFLLRDLLASGVPITYVTGNHDHWIGDFLSVELGIEVVGDRLELDTGAGKILAMHGDGLAKSDWKYRLLKKVLRNRVCIALYKLLPPSLAYWLAYGAAQSSRRHTAKRPRDRFLEEYREYGRQMLAGDYCAFICGHTHHPELLRFGEKYFLNTGDWISHFSYIRFADGEFQLLSMLDQT